MTILKIITDWDPQRLMGHAPDDEYEIEAELIEKSIMTVKNDIDLALIIKEIFVEQFGNDFIRPEVECLETANKILKSGISFTVNVNGEGLRLVIGKKYRFIFKDMDISFNNMDAVVEDTNWFEEETGERFFFIYVIEQEEDYLISDRELEEIIKV